ncbi:nicotinate-nucleotide--dimethylbenzimidazole phosphoribosyltransferase [Pseudaquabacterium rugosum]|jgi:nicotinate-nucleotide--dimethylbenzimidazole phosphoribosyltransferase|uniref:Nicotinate-nucleotide--dimethylbenzimidazole phosphoribosyltransferase n=1 Tax=Pseudaquabacterium rugosum TaxID=2984194 RepID=A0ABU9B7J0_9BURK
MTPIAETSNPLLEQALLARLQAGGRPVGQLGHLAPVAIRLGLLQNSLRPRLHDPQLVLVASDHGLAVDGLPLTESQPTEEQVAEVLGGRVPVARLAHQMGLALTVVDGGIARQMPPLERLLPRKLAHGTRNARMGMAMTIEQAQASVRAGIETAQGLSGNVVACGALGSGAHEAAALVLSRLGEVPLRDLLYAGPDMHPDQLSALLLIGQSVHGRHRDCVDPIEVLACFGGFEIGLLTGLLLEAANRRHLLLIDGMSACAALLIARMMEPAITDYCVFCRSTPHHGLDQAMALFEATAMLDVGLATHDGAGACLTWPMLRAACALLGDDHVGERALPPLEPAAATPPPIRAAHEPRREVGTPSRSGGLDLSRPVTVDQVAGLSVHAQGPGPRIRSSGHSDLDELI